MILWIIFLIFPFSVCAMEDSDDDKEARRYIVNITHPCSQADFLLRSVSEHPQIEGYNEPFLPIHIAKHYGDEEEQKRVRFGTVHRHFNQNQKPIIFIQEMGFSFEEWLEKYPSCGSRNDFHYIFFIDDPKNALISYYQHIQKGPYEYHVDRQESYESIVCLDKLYGLFCKLKKQSPNPVSIIFAKDLNNDPKTILQCLSNKIKIKYTKKLLTWKPIKDLEKEETPWIDWSSDKIIQHWHHDVLESSGFKTKTTQYDFNFNSTTFEEINNQKHREILKKVFIKQLSYYQKFKEEAEHHITKN